MVLQLLCIVLSEKPGLGFSNVKRSSLVTLLYGRSRGFWSTYSFLKNSNKVMKKLQISKAGQIPRCTSYFFNYQQHMKIAIFSKSIFFHTCLWWGRPPFVASMLKCVNFLSAPHFQSYQTATADINTWISRLKTKAIKLAKNKVNCVLKHKKVSKSTWIP